MAMAPERTGIGIRRHFTRDGVHPYDEIEWDIRDARITNFQDGAVAFEQPDVEVPRSWSLNATNILAQKYFRGTPGTPERERSLRQVADRVADTITAWGIKDGYFVDAPEAEAFNAELKHLIVTQKAAFNSPVWFNIGVKGVPQQASACQPYDALVSTPDGLRPIGELVETNAVGEKVFDANGLTRIVAVKANGTKRVLRVHTKAGYILDVTPDHLVWRASDERYGRFVQAGDLRAGDKLEWHDVAVVDARQRVTVEIARVEDIGEMPVYDIQTESGEYLSGGLRVHNCFILAVDDTMDSILNWYVEEGIIFKGGSGSGINLSRIRSSYEQLNGGGTPSGPVSFMRGADASAGTIKSGGKTRRAAKMVILNADHPDIEDFIWCKAIEERKARALRDAGFDMDLDGKDSHSTQYQNANNSVRVTDEFMQAVLDDDDWDLNSVTTGEAVRTVKARELFRQIAKSAWECADPGMQFDTTINRWHTAKNTGRINGSNPCFTGDSLVHTDKGLIPFAELIDRSRLGESFGVYTHDTTNAESPTQRMEITTPNAFMITGVNEVVKLRFDNGMELRSTPGHKIFTTNRGYVEASELTPDDEVKLLDLAAPAVAADWRLPVSADVRDYAVKGDWSRSLQLPEKWTPELAHYLGWLVGDGCISGDVVSTVYGGDDEQATVVPAHQELIAGMNGERAPKPSVQPNGTVQLRQSRRVIARFLEALGISHAKAADKRVPWSVEQAPSEVVAAFLRGLFDADGCVYDGAKSRYVGLGSASPELLRGVQRLLTTFGVTSRIYATQTQAKRVFRHRRSDGSETDYESKPMYDLRISGAMIDRFERAVGFSLLRKARKLANLLETHRLKSVRTTARLVERVDDGVEVTYNLSEPRNHSYVVNGVVVRNCSEYMHLDNSACNLASINLLKFYEDETGFDVDGYKAAVEVVFTAQEILVGNADYPTEKIAQTSRRFRQLGIGYANLGALLMAMGMPYDSDEGRAWAGALTALMTGHSYETSARTAARMGPFAGFSENREHVLNVLRMHREEVAKIDEELVQTSLLDAAQEAWDNAVELGEEFGVRNSQASVLAPTGCLVGGSFVPTERGLVRLRSLGDSEGAEWQGLGINIQTDEGPRQATKFHVNGLEPVVDVTTRRGYRIQGTPRHRVKVVDEETGEWQWRHFADVERGDLVPLALDQLIGDPQTVALPPISEKMAWAGEHHVEVPREMTPELAEFVGYFMGDGSLHSRGLRMTVTAGDLDVVDHLSRLGKSLFGIEARAMPSGGDIDVCFHSIRLTDWWEASGFAKFAPREGHRGKGYVPHIPDAVLHTNDREVYRSFLRGLYEADGCVIQGYASWTTAKVSFADDVQYLLLALGFVTTRKFDVSGRGSQLVGLRLLNKKSNDRWLREIGFVSSRKNRGVDVGHHPQTARYDHIPVTRGLIDRIVPENGPLRKVAMMECRRHRSVSRRLAEELLAHKEDAELRNLLRFYYDRVVTAELGDEELTYDLSVPDNVTYIANGFISHNTIGLLMDCDTTGIEPDLSLVKMKKLVGGGTMSIVNQTVPRALRHLGYDESQIAEIVVHIDEHKSIFGAPHVSPDHMPVFACSMGDNTIHYMGHIRMMVAVQPFLSGAISKTANMPEEATVEDVEQLHIDAWRMGLKAVAIYRDNCKVAQPLSTVKKAVASAPEAHDAELAQKVAELEDALAKQTTVVVKQPIRERLPRRRRSSTYHFRVADCEGYAHVGEYDDGRPGELFIKASKQGSTLAGILDAFSISISLGLQHGVPLQTYVQKYTNMRFEPAGMTDDPDLRIATSLLDYIFRRMAVDYMPYEARAELGILTSHERTQPTLPGVDEEITPSLPLVDEPAIDEPMVDEPVVDVRSGDPGVAVPPSMVASDAPLCMQCGVQMIRSGSCHACPSCGTTSGCS